MRPVILYRELGNNSDQLEIQAAQKAGFKVLKNRVLVESGDLVIPRYSAIPFFKNLEEDIAYLGGKTINTLNQHNYVSDL